MRRSPRADSATSASTSTSCFSHSTTFGIKGDNLTQLDPPPHSLPSASSSSTSSVTTTNSPTNSSTSTWISSSSTSNTNEFFDAEMSFVTATNAITGSSNNNKENSNFHHDDVCVCGKSVFTDSTTKFLIECNFCWKWFHGTCVNMNEKKVLSTLNFACPTCKKNGKQIIKTERYIPEMDELQLPMKMDLSHFDLYDPEDNQRSHDIIPTIESPSSAQVQQYNKTQPLFQGLLKSEKFTIIGVQRVPAQQILPAFFKLNGLEKPILSVGNSWIMSGHGQPFPVIGLEDITGLLSAGCSVTSLDVESQEEFKLSSANWHTRMSPHAPDLYNAFFCIAETPFRSQVVIPLAVAAIDWHQLLPIPNEEVYGALFGPHSYQDFRLNLAGKSTWIYMSEGEAWVYLIPPLEKNLEAYHRWHNSSFKSTTFLADYTDKCIKCVVDASETLFIPGGWMYSVYSEKGCALFAGFFLHTMNLHNQIQVMKREDSILTTNHEAAKGRAQLWTAIYHYNRNLSNQKTGFDIAPLEFKSIESSLPQLRQWICNTNAVWDSPNLVASGTWYPRSASEALKLIENLETLLHAWKQRTMGATTNKRIMQHTVSNKSAMTCSWLSSSSDFDQAMQSILELEAATPMQQDPFHAAPPLVSAGYQEVMNSNNQTTGYGLYPHTTPSLQSTPSFSSNTTYPAASPVLLPSPAYGSFSNQAHQFHVHKSPYNRTSQIKAVGDLQRHRASCHRCGNLRKRNLRCSNCPHIFCHRCAEKMLEEHGNNIFVSGCPVCKEICCCGKNRTPTCTRKFHCYKKCPSTKPRAASMPTSTSPVLNSFSYANRTMFSSSSSVSP